MKKWRKILYEKQPFDDEYSGGDEFLKELRKNVSAVEYSFMEAVSGASRVMLHADAVVAYFLVFKSLSKVPELPPSLLFALSAVAALLYVFYLSIANVPRKIIPDHVHTLITFLSFGYALTPVIRTLTDAVSTDTIYAMSVSLFIISFVFHDYAMSAPLVSMVVSVNLSLAASVCLVSRVRSNNTAFCLLAISMALFSSMPSLRNVLAVRFPRSPLLINIFCLPPVLYSLYHYSPPLSAILLILQLFVVLVCPWILIRMQPLKSTIHGPWDEASLH